MILFIVVLVVIGLAYWAYQSAWAHVTQFILVRRIPGEGPEQIVGWDVLAHVWPFMVFGALLALIVLPLLTRSYRAADRADLQRTIEQERHNAQTAQQLASEAEHKANRRATRDYEKRYLALEKREAAHKNEIDDFIEESEGLMAEVAIAKKALADAVKEAEEATKAKNNAMATATRQRKKAQKLKAKLDDLTSGNR